MSEEEILNERIDRIEKSILRGRRPDLDITPLWWALALGAGFGGNATPIGSTANIVVVSVSEKTKHPITTRMWLRNGLPIMIVTCVVATILYVLRFEVLK